MKTMILAMVATLTLGLSSAYADAGGVTCGNTAFTQLPGVCSKSATGSAPPVQMTQTPNGRPEQRYANRSVPGQLPQGWIK